MVSEIMRTTLEGKATAKLKGVGKAKAEARITGTQINQIRTANEANVSFITSELENHYASTPTSAVRLNVEANASVPKILGIKLGKTTKKKVLEWYYFDRCDFCGTGQEYDVNPTEQEALIDRSREAYQNALIPINTVQEQVNKYTIFDRVLVPISDIKRTTNTTSSATKARYGAEEYLAAQAIYELNRQNTLQEELRMDAAQISAYRLWTNSETFQSVYLLPNATQLYAGPGEGRPQFITDILYGDALQDGRARFVAVYSALTDYAYAHPVVSIGSTGVLDFETGIFTIPSFADVELYLHEVSSAWLIEALESGFFRTEHAEPEAVNNCALNGGSLPNGVLTEDVVADGEVYNWTVYWLGDTPLTAEDDDQPLLYLLADPETDEVIACRTSKRMLQEGEGPIVTSLLICRDTASDAREEEKYNVFFFDTPEGEMSIVKVITNTMSRTTMEMPRSLQVVLRAFPTHDSDVPAYSINDCVLELSQRRDGTATALNGAYAAVYTSNVFDGPYTRVEGITEGEFVITIKPDQPVWEIIH